MRILVADLEDSFILDAHQAYLQGRGYETLTAANAEECCSSLETFRPDVLIIDSELYADQRFAQLRNNLQCLANRVILVEDASDDSPELPESHVQRMKRPYRLCDMLTEIRMDKGPSPLGPLRDKNPLEAEDILL